MGKSKNPTNQTHSVSTTPKANVSPIDRNSAISLSATGESAESSLIACLLFCCCLFLYSRTVYPSITGGDSGELVVTACNFGVAHPPGYPTFSFLAGVWLRVFRFLFGWSAAYSVNLFGCFCASLTAHFIYRICVLLSGNNFIGIWSAVAFAFSPTVWLYSIQGEVFPLNNLLCSVMAYLAVKYYRSETELAAFIKSLPSNSASYSSADSELLASLKRRTFRLSVIGAFICGLALTNQHTTVFYVFPTVLFVVASLFELDLLNPRSILILFAALFTGISPYLYLIIQSHNRVMDSWGDQRDLSGFLTHFLRREYGTFQLAASEISEDPGMISRLGVYFAVTMKETLFVVIPLSVIGIFSLMRSRHRNLSRSGILLFVCYVLYTIVFHKLANLDMRPLFLGVQARFWQQINLFLCIWAGCGVLFIIRLLTIPGSLADRCAIISLVFLGSSIQIGYHYRTFDHSDNDIFHRNGIQMLDSFPSNAIILLNGDLNNNMVKYPHQCENVRPDLEMPSLQLMTWDWFVPMQRHNYPKTIFPGNRYHVSFKGSFNIKQFLDANTPRHPVFLCGPFKDGDWSNHINPSDASKGLHYSEWPFGACSQLLPAGIKPANLTEFLLTGLTGLARPVVDYPKFDAVKYGPETWENIVYADTYSRLSFIASFTAFHSNRNSADLSLLRLAKALQDEILNGDNEKELFQRGNLGAQDYRTAGVIYGNWAKHLMETGQQATEQFNRAELQMLAAWTKYVQLKPDEKEIAPFVKGKVNPYTGKTIENSENLNPNAPISNVRGKAETNFIDQMQDSQLQSQVNKKSANPNEKKNNKSKKSNENEEESQNTKEIIKENAEMKKKTDKSEKQLENEGNKKNRKTNTEQQTKEEKSNQNPSQNQKDDDDDAAVESDLDSVNSKKKKKRKAKKSKKKSSGHDEL